MGRSNLIDNATGAIVKRKYPLELILRAHGPAELVDAEQSMIWVSDVDDDFRVEFNDEFLEEEDIPEILDYLADHGILNEMEFNALNSDRWDCTVETLPSSVDEDDLDPNDGDDDDAEDLTEYDDD